MAHRKAIVYFAQGLQPDSNTNDMLKSIMGEANRSGVSIYVVDLNAIDWQASQKLMTTIAMGNADPAVKAAAKHTVDSVDRGGLAQALDMAAAS